MTTHDIDVTTLVPHGQAATSVEDGMLNVMMMRTLPRLDRDLPLVVCEV